MRETLLSAIALAFALGDNVAETVTGSRTPITGFVGGFCCGVESARALSGDAPLLLCRFLAADCPDDCGSSAIDDENDAE